MNKEALDAARIGKLYKKHHAFSLSHFDAPIKLQVGLEAGIELSH